MRKRIRVDVPNKSAHRSALQVSYKFYSGTPINKCSRSIINMVGQFQSNSTDMLLSRADTVELQALHVCVLCSAVRVNGVRILEMYTRNTIYSIRRIEYIVLIF